MSGNGTAPAEDRKTVKEVKSMEEVKDVENANDVEKVEEVECVSVAETARVEDGEDGEFVSPLPSNLCFRRLEGSDYSKGYIELLSQLTTVGNISEEQFTVRLEELKKRASDYHLFVIEDTEAQRIVAAGTVSVELKFIHECSQIGRIEEIVVDQSLRGKHLGKRMIHELTKLAKALGCYKVILNCKESNVPFYEKCGYERKSVLMAKYFD